MEKDRMMGLVIPSITPMNEDGSLDEQGIENFADYLVKAGVNCLYPNGTNGESLLLTKEERQCQAELVVKANGGRIATFIQCGAMTTKETVEHAQHSERIGANGVGIMSPAFFPMDEEALFVYYSEVIKGLSKDFPVYIYNIPGCTTNDVKPSLLARLMDTFTNVKGIKFSSSNLMQVEDYLNLCSRKPDLLIGCDSLYLQCLITGGVGTVTGPGSIFHERFTRLYRQFIEGDIEAAMATQRQIVVTDRKLAGIPGIPALKALLKIRGVIRTDVCRGPLRVLSKEEYKLLHEIWEEYCKEENINE